MCFDMGQVHFYAENTATIRDLQCHVKQMQNRRIGTFSVPFVACFKADSQSNKVFAHVF